MADKTSPFTSHPSDFNGKDNKKRDPDLTAAEIAMKRAAAKARQKAKQVGAGVVLWEGGQVVEERQNTSPGE